MQVRIMFKVNNKKHQNRFIDLWTFHTIFNGRLWLGKCYLRVCLYRKLCIHSPYQSKAKKVKSNKSQVFFTSETLARFEIKITRNPNLSPDEIMISNTFFTKITKSQFFTNTIWLITTAWNVSKYGPEITPYLDTFHAVTLSNI